MGSLAAMSSEIDCRGSRPLRGLDIDHLGRRRRTAGLRSTTRRIVWLSTRHAPFVPAGRSGIVTDAKPDR